MMMMMMVKRMVMTMTMMMTMMMMMMMIKALWDGFIVFIAMEERLRGEVREGQAGQKSQVRIIPGVLGQRDHFCIVT